MKLSNALQAIRQNNLILPVYVPSLIFAFAQGMLVPILPLYAIDFGVSYGLIGLLLAGEALGMLFGDVPAGMLIRRLGKKWSMLAGVGLAALTTIALMWAQSIPEALVYRLLSGFGIALFSVARHAYLAEMVTISSRGRAIALFGGVSRIGRFAGPAIGGFVAAVYGLRTPFLVFGLINAITLLVVGLFVYRTHTMVVAGSPSRKHHLFATLKAHYRVLTSAGTAQLFAQMIRAGRDVIIPLYAADILGLNVQQIGLIISVAAAVDMTLFYPAGLLMDRLGRKFAIVPCFALQAIGMALIPLTASFGGLIAAACLIAFGNGLGSGTMMTLGADLSPPETRGEFLGVWRLIGDVGASGAPIVAGAVAEILVLPAAALVLSGAGFVAVAVFAFMVPETLARTRVVAGEPTN